MAVQKFRKKPVVIEAVQWAGDNEKELAAFAGANFETVHDSPEWTARVFDVLHDSWIGARTGDWVVRGVRGENYPVHQEVLDETYDLIADDGA
jgi:hypothetical protein